MEIVTHDEASEDMELSYCPLARIFANRPATAVESELASVLLLGSDAVSAVRSVRVGSPQAREHVAKRVAVGRLVVDERCGDVLGRR